MTSRQLSIVDALKAESEEFTTMRQLAMRFNGLFRERSAEKLDEWLRDAFFLRHFHYATFRKDIAPRQKRSAKRSDRAMEPRPDGGADQPIEYA
jgi:hypothetical protein